MSQLIDYSRIMIIILLLAPIHLLYPKGNLEIWDAIDLQMINLNDNEKRLLDITGIIIIRPNRWPINIVDYNGVSLTDIVISDKLVPNYMDRYYITHYLRNQMHSMSETYDPIQREFVPVAVPFIFPGYDSYIRRNAEIICTVIYHFISRNHYKVYINFPDQCYLLLNDNRLGIYLDFLIDKLREEGLSFPLHYRMWKY